jgi:hypothetical protein
VQVVELGQHLADTLFTIPAASAPFFRIPAHDGVCAARRSAVQPPVSDAVRAGRPLHDAMKKHVEGSGAARRVIIGLGSLAFALCFAVNANGQTTHPLRGDVAAIDKTTLRLKSASGQETTIRLPDDILVSVRVPAKLDDIKSGTFVGTAATPRSGSASARMGRCHRSDSDFLFHDFLFHDKGRSASTARARA